MKLTYILLLLAFTMSACHAAKSPKSTATSGVDSTTMTEVPKPRNSHYANRLNQTARIIAGIYDPTDTLFMHIRHSKAWKNYAQESDSVWDKYFTNNQALMNFANNEVRPLGNSVKRLFYPFSGPDYLYANLFFPNTEMLYMLGLEKLGSVPQFDKAANADGYINAYKTSINEVLTDSYYRTIQMMRYLNNQSVDGVIPVIMLFMARADKQISEINHLTLNEDGTPRIVTRAELKNCKPEGVEIKYYAGGDNNIERRIIYLKGDAQESALANNTAYKNFFLNMEADAAFTKSASYLLHHAIFATVRNSILRTCKLVVSDDTGIAFRYYKPTQWKIQLYGSYNGCINDFKYIFEDDLKAAYNDSTKIRPLPFRIGYSRPSNMRIATRKP